MDFHPPSYPSRYVLSYLRDGFLYLPTEKEKQQAIFRELDYFCIETKKTYATFLKKDWFTTHVLTEHTDIVMCLRVVDDGKKLVTGSKDKTVRMWDTNTGECLRTYTGMRYLKISAKSLLGHSNSVRHIKVIGDKLITASHDKTVKVWNSTTGEIIHSLTGHSEYVMCLTVLDSGVTFKLSKLTHCRAYFEWVPRFNNPRVEYRNRRVLC